jgi:hypothetical protein
MWKNIVDPETDDNMAQVHFTLITQGYKHTLRTCNTNFFSTATIVAPTGLKVRVYLKCMSRYLPYKSMSRQNTLLFYILHIIAKKVKFDKKNL